MVLSQAEAVALRADRKASQRAKRQRYDELVEEVIAAWDKSNAALEDARWVTGDAALEVETAWGEERLQRFAAELRKEYGTVREYRRVAQRFPFATRVAGVSWTVHRRLAGIKEDQECFELLQQAADNSWTDKQAKEVLANVGGLLDSNPKTRGVPRTNVFDEGRDFDTVEEETPSDAKRWKRFVDAFHDVQDLPWGVVAENIRFSNLMRSQHVRSELAALESWAAEMQVLLE